MTKFIIETSQDESEVRGILDDTELDYVLTTVPEKSVPDAPCKFLFGLDDPFQDDGLYVWIVAEPLYRNTGYVDDSSSAHSALYGEDGRRRQWEHDDEEEDFIENVHTWLDYASRDILFGEGMESAWETERREDETWEQSAERVKQALIERGFIHEPKLDKAQ